MDLRARAIVLGIMTAFTWAPPGRIPVACAQPSESQAAGRALFDEGMQLFEQRKYSEACPKFEASLARLAGIGTRGKLAECYEKLGRTASAWSLYQKVAVLAAQAGETAREKVARDRADALEPNLARVTIVPPSTVDIDGLVVKRNGEPLGQGDFGSAIPVDPGDLLIEASAPDRKPWQKQIRATAAISIRVEIPTLEREHEAPSIVAAPDNSSAWPWQRTAGLALSGAGVVSMLVGGAFGLSAKSTYDGAFDANCRHSDNTCTAAGQADIDSANHKALASTLFVGGGLVLVATGAGLFFTAPKRRAPSAHALHVLPEISPGRAGLLVSGRL